MSAKIGQRVGAIQSADANTVHLYGFGTYVGDEIPPPGVALSGIDLHELGVKTPKIELDNGNVIWGCQCWWGAEEHIRAALEFDGREIIKVIEVNEVKSQ